jgi:hypothetical protein
MGIVGSSFLMGLLIELSDTSVPRELTTLTPITYLLQVRLVLSHIFTAKSRSLPCSSCQLCEYHPTEVLIDVAINMTDSVKNPGCGLSTLLSPMQRMF